MNCDMKCERCEGKKIEQLIMSEERVCDGWSLTPPYEKINKGKITKIVYAEDRIPDCSEYWDGLRESDYIVFENGDILEAQPWTEAGDAYIKYTIWRKARD